ncbi:hypothetical protein [Neisseria weaveri]|uniref:Integral membrane protein n=1 Tax=Neisseria weaveri TaxID=28091 RepID=A0A448VPE1_9NEIS|nr:hypothetical protein [Neisseria weaveri]EGV34994.1 hypothetical protein l13_18550 [Neisseria weaveri ATCC 51223]EGV37435.1 hypothetical protein l11_11880 [Neisseria weaveri LMG 5135]SAY50176.1 Uncharacterised protein [Neisseria weaveri]VEJ51582.1 Uncharacterised protein [Neisseria weaveri]
MLSAFILGFWVLWSDERDVNIFYESLMFILVNVLLTSALEFHFPAFSLLWALETALLWCYVIAALMLIQKLSVNFMITIAMSIAIAVGYYHLAGQADIWVASWLAKI